MLAYLYYSASSADREALRPVALASWVRPTVAPRQAVRSVARLGPLPLRWARRMRRRSSPRLDHARLRWFRDETTTYHLIARYVVPAALWLPARVTVEGLEHVPLTGPVILAANHPDNWDGYLLLHLVPRTVHVAARQDAFGTGA